MEKESRNTTSIVKSYQDIIDILGLGKLKRLVRKFESDVGAEALKQKINNNIELMLERKIEEDNCDLGQAEAQQLAHNVLLILLKDSAIEDIKNNKIINEGNLHLYLGTNGLNFFETNKLQTIGEGATTQVFALRPYISSPKSRVLGIDDMLYGLYNLESEDRIAILNKQGGDFVPLTHWSKVKVYTDNEQKSKVIRHKITDRAVSDARVYLGTKKSIDISKKKAIIDNLAEVLDKNISLLRSCSSGGEGVWLHSDIKLENILVYEDKDIEKPIFKIADNNIHLYKQSTARANYYFSLNSEESNTWQKEVLRDIYSAAYAVFNAKIFLGITKQNRIEIKAMNDFIADAYNQNLTAEDLDVMQKVLMQAARADQEIVLRNLKQSYDAISKNKESPYTKNETNKEGLYKDNKISAVKNNTKRGCGCFGW